MKQCTSSVLHVCNDQEPMRWSAAAELLQLLDIASLLCHDLASLPSPLPKTTVLVSSDSSFLPCTIIIQWQMSEPQRTQPTWCIRHAWDCVEQHVGYDQWLASYLECSEACYSQVLATDWVKLNLQYIKACAVPSQNCHAVLRVATCKQAMPKHDELREFSSS